MTNDRRRANEAGYGYGREAEMQARYGAPVGGYGSQPPVTSEKPAPDAMPEIQDGDALTVEDDLGQRYEHRVETQADAKVPKGYKAVRLRRVIWRQEAQP